MKLMRMSKRPTLAEVAVALSDEYAYLRGTVTGDVLEACRLRGVPVRDGRVPRERVPDIYFGLTGEPMPDRRIQARRRRMGPLAGV